MPPRMCAMPHPLEQKVFNEAASNKDYTTTAWVDGAAAAEAAAVGPTPPPLADVSALRPGMLRRASYSGSMMGSKVGGACRLQGFHCTWLSSCGCFGPLGACQRNGIPLCTGLPVVKRKKHRQYTVALARLHARNPRHASYATVPHPTPPHPTPYLRAGMHMLHAWRRGHFIAVLSGSPPS